MSVLQHLIQIGKKKQINHSAKYETDRRTFPILTIDKYGHRTLHLLHNLINLIPEER